MSNSRSHKEQMRIADAEQALDAREVSTYKVKQKYNTKGKNYEDKGNPAPGRDGMKRESLKLTLETPEES